MFDPEQERPPAAPPHGGQAVARPGFPLDPRRLTHALWRRKLLLVGIAVIFAVVGVVVGKFVAPKTYRASSTVLWEPPAEARADAVRELNTLAQSVKLPDNLRSVRKRLALEKTLEGLAGSIDVRVGEHSMLITISATSEDPETCAQVANVLVDVFLDAQKEVVAARLREVVRALRASLVDAEGDLREAKRAYEQFRERNAIADVSVETQAAIEELARLRVQANDARVELEALRSREASLRASRDESPAEVVASRQETAPAAARLSEARAKLAEARAKLTPDHPRVRALQAEVEALEREAATSGPAVTSRVVARSSLRDNLAAQVEEMTALRKSIEQRKETLDEVLARVQKRAAALTSAQTEAARLLANVEIGQKHVSSLLEQIATAEDDVRKATSSFQVVSRAEPPPWPEKGKGKILAAAIPAVALLLTVLVVVGRALWPPRASGACELAFFGSAPVLWASSWPGSSTRESQNLSRELADVLEPHDAVVAFTSATEADDLTPWIADLVVERLQLRGCASEVVDLRKREPASDALSIADVLEGQGVGAEIQAARSRKRLVFVLLPPLDQVDAVRAARRWFDALIVVAPSGTVSPLTLWSLRKAVGIDHGSLGFVAVRMPPWLLSPGTRAFGTFEVTTDWKSVAPPIVVDVE